MVCDMANRSRYGARLKTQENTILSFVTAATLGAEYIESVSIVPPILPQRCLHVA